MQFSLAHKQRTDGFTLVEMLVIAPVVIVLIGVLIGAMVTIVGDVLITRDRNTLTYSAQEALDSIEQDTRLANQFLTTTGTLTSPQGSNNNFTGTTAFSNASSFIISVNATTKNPTDIMRQLVYKALPNACGVNQIFNAILPVQIIYFIKSGSLWRRAVVPTYNTNGTADANTVCSAPWQRNTCSPGYAVGICQTNDTEIMQNIDTFAVKYYLDASSTTELGTANAANASTVEVTINGKKTTAGREFTNSTVLRADKLN